MAARRKASSIPPLFKDDAERLTQAIHVLGNYSHVTVRPGRGHLNIFADHDQPIARFTPLGAGRYGLSFHTHSGRWEPMPFMGNASEIAQALVTALAPYLEREHDLSRKISGSHH
jgi:hypothetical protein